MATVRLYRCGWLVARGALLARLLLSRFESRLRECGLWWSVLARPLVRVFLCGGPKWLVL